MADATEKRIRISNMLAVLMGGVAVGVDLVQGILTTGVIGIAINSFISIFAWLMFWFWFKMHGVGFLDGKLVLKSVTMWGAGLIELVPLINNLPAWTVAIVIMLFIVKAEDAIYNKTGKSINMAKNLKKSA
jgi:hypothetical protein